MKWFFTKKEAPVSASADLMDRDERGNLLEELKQAHSDWNQAQRRLDWALDKDQIDYAIYALEAAEKKYEMLLRQAKQYSWNVRHHTMRRTGT